jgi:hypothetical protein
MNALQSLESRRLFSFFLAGGDQTLPLTGTVTGVDVATASDGRSIVAAHVITGQTVNITAIRYDAIGNQLGDPVIVVSVQTPAEQGPPIGVPSICVSINDSGQAMIAWQVTDADNERLYVAHVSGAGVASAPILVEEVQREVFGWPWQPNRLHRRQRRLLCRLDPRSRRYRRLGSHRQLLRLCAGLRCRGSAQGRRVYPRRRKRRPRISGSTRHRNKARRLRRRLRHDHLQKL